MSDGTRGPPSLATLHWQRARPGVVRSRRFWLFVSDAPFTSFDPNVTRAQSGVSSYRYAGAPGGNLTFLVNRTGRYVGVQLIDAEFLQLAEVQVWAPASPLMVNLAAGKRERLLVDGALRAASAQTDRLNSLGARDAR
jgi:hypothetical protein